MGYGPPGGLAANRILEGGYTPPVSGLVNAILPMGSVFVSGVGFLAGQYPNGITTVEGVPVTAEVRVLLRKDSGILGDGQIVAITTSNADGTWHVGGLDPSLRYDVVARKTGQNDVIMANITPAV